ncbi:TPA: glycosyltransferase, partial [Candidatus Bipolaricaulota bacterium]|nr:glycosyltransferase [Candidatus Bipolaricaulota bacterium]
PSRVRLKIYGRVYPLRYARFIEKAVKRFPQGQVESHGRYSPDELPDIFAQLDVLVIPTRWHETYNLVLWEAWGAELPVIVSRVGALADVVREGVDGLTFSPGDWRELRAVIERIAEAPGLIEEMRRNLPRVGITIEENVRRYEELFRGVVGP